MEAEDMYKQMEQSEKEEKREKYRILNRYVREGGILLAGSSLMEGFPINELLMDRGVDLPVYNRGIGGYTTKELAESMDVCIFDLKPSKIFINIGSNDIAAEDYSLAQLILNYTGILKEIKRKLPDTVVYVMAYYPVNERDHFLQKPDKSWLMHRNNRNIREANEELQKMARVLRCRYVDANRGLVDEFGQLRREYTIEGIHIYGNGYHVILDYLLACFLE